MGAAPIWLVVIRAIFQEHLHQIRIALYDSTNKQVRGQFIFAQSIAEDGIGWVLLGSPSFSEA
jgi:hypothetical protein